MLGARALLLERVSQYWWKGGIDTLFNALLSTPLDAPVFLGRGWGGESVEHTMHKFVICTYSLKAYVPARMA
jgi:hypothetical protein